MRDMAEPASLATFVSADENAGLLGGYLSLYAGDISIVVRHPGRQQLRSATPQRKL
jgi:hypothetical protein